MYMLINISRSKGNQTIKLGQLTEYNVRIIFLEKSYTKCDAKLVPHPFLKTQNLPYLWINSLKIYTGLSKH